MLKGNYFPIVNSLYSAISSLALLGNLRDEILHEDEDQHQGTHDNACPP
jgi:hypothetical protein